ncbi:hypothetical protein [Streptosporangium subroseum]|uniref:hypothetical protein n=1 Tax=Streptosporangium subroseum TaxID=106412 RepID=UPI0030862082|nr:hypothetical protein OHB15_13965 [Streptosporangium subroseum]
MVPQHVIFAPSANGLRLRHAQPRPGDWGYGVLRARAKTNRRGKPNLKAVNTRRQWQYIDQGRCQVCRRPARDRVTGRWWWLLADDGKSAAQGYTNAPPTCRGCIPEAITQCPHLREAAAVYTAGSYEPYGVLANLYVPFEGLALPQAEGVELKLSDSRIGQALATQLLVFLRELRPELPPAG